MFKLNKKKDKHSDCEFTTKPGVTFSSITEKKQRKKHRKALQRMQ